MNKTILDKVLDLKNKVSDTYNEVTDKTNNLATSTYNIIDNSTNTVLALKNKVSVLSDMFTDLRVLNGTAKNIIYLSSLPIVENEGIKILNDKLELDTTSKSYKEINVRKSSIASLEKYTLTTTDKKKTDIDSFLKSGVDTIVSFPNNRYTFNLNLSYNSLEQINNIDIQLGLLTNSYPIINSIKYIDKDNVEQTALILNNTSTSYDLDYNREQDNLYSIEISPILTDQIIIEFTSKTQSNITFKDVKTSFKKEVEQGTVTLGPIHTNTPLLKIAIDTDDISTGSSFEFSTDLEYWIPLESSSIITDQSNTKILSFNTINSNSIKSTEDLYTFYIRINIASTVLTNSDTNINIYNTFRENNSMNNDTLDLVEDNLFSVYKVRNSDFIHGDYQYIESLNIKDFSLDVVEYLEVNGIPKVLGLVDTPYSITKNTTINSGGIGAELKYKRLPSENILDSRSYDVANSKIYDIYERALEEKINIREKDNLCFSLKRKTIAPTKTREPRCFAFSNALINSLENPDTEVITSYFANYPVGDNYITVNGNHITSSTVDNKLQLAENSFITIVPSEYEEVVYFRALEGNDRIVIKICSVEPIPIDKSPFWVVNAEITQGFYLHNRDSSGYETIVIVMNTQDIIMSSETDTDDLILAEDLTKLIYDRD